MRGEYLFSRLWWESLLELPPRARRIQHHENIGGVNLGTTSACAENTLRYTRESDSHWNYLRVRGEYMRDFQSRAITGELPPRARRILTDTGVDTTPPGTTSACAENTGGGRLVLILHGNYLRVRGEYVGQAWDL